MQTFASDRCFPPNHLHKPEQLDIGSCVINGNVSGVAFCLANGQDPDTCVRKDTRSGSSVTCLHYASSLGNLPVVRELINYNADINRRTANRGFTPLHFAVKGGHYQVAVMLLKAGANVHARDNKLNATALEMAISLHGFELASLLVEYNANLLDSDSNGFPYLHLSYLCHNHDVYYLTLQLITSYGMDVNQKNRYGHTLLDHAVRYGDMPGIAELTKLGAIGGSKDPLLFLASRKSKENPKKNRLEVFYRIIELGADIHFYERKYRRNALHCLAEIEPLGIKHHDEVFCRLTAHFAMSGVSVDERTERGDTALMIACSKGNVSLVRCILSLKASPYLFDTNGFTALHLAVQKDNHNVVKCMMKDYGIKADIHDQSSTEATPLIWSCSQAAFKSALALIENGADVMQGCRRTNFLPLHAAARTGDIEVFNLVMERMYYVAESRISRESNVKKGFSIKSSDIKRKKAWFGNRTKASKNEYAIGAVNIAFTEMLNRREEYYGFTALHYAAQFGHTKICDELIQAGCEINVVDYEGYTPYDHALYYGNAFVAELLSRYAPMNVQSVVSAGQKEEIINTPVKANSNNFERGESFKSHNSFDSFSGLDYGIGRYQSMGSLDSSISN